MDTLSKVAKNKGPGVQYPLRHVEKTNAETHNFRTAISVACLTHVQQFEDQHDI